MNTHIINKQIIELKVNSEENAFGLQQQARDAYMSNVLPLISEVLDELAGPDEVLRIDRLELDFGVLSIDKLGQQMKERVREAFLKQLPDLRQKKTNNEKLSFSVIETVAGGKKSLAERLAVLVGMLGDRRGIVIADLGRERGHQHQRAVHQLLDPL